MFRDVAGVIKDCCVQTMAHQPMNINDWIEIDKDLPWYIEEKQRVIKEQGPYYYVTYGHYIADSLRFVALQERSWSTRSRKTTTHARKFSSF